MDQFFDIVIIGGGMTGLSLAKEIINHLDLSTIKVLLIEPRKQYQQDKIWSFWNVKEQDFSDILLQSWSSFSLHNFEESVTIDHVVEYVSIDSGKFYSQIIDEIDNQTGIDIMLNTSVIAIERFGEFVDILLSNDTTIRTAQVFDSRPPETLPERNFDLLQHFKGLHIQTDTPTFNPEEVVLMDFRTDQRWGLHFIYVLPFSTTEALIEATWFSHNTVSDSIYDEMLDQYFQTHNITNYEIKYTEKGVIPMTTGISQPRKWSPVINIGTRGGLTRPSTGYTFLSAQWYCKELVKQFDQRREEREVPIIRSRWINYLDEVLLRVLAKHPTLGPVLFVKLFKKQPPSRIIAFLSGTSSLIDELKIMIKSPFKWAFIKEAMFGFFNRLKPW